MSAAIFVVILSIQLIMTKLASITNIKEDFVFFKICLRSKSHYQQTVKLKVLSIKAEKYSPHPANRIVEHRKHGAESEQEAVVNGKVSAGATHRIK